MNPVMPKIRELESESREFKEAAKLRSPKGREALVHSIASFMNGEGGEIWIGFREEKGMVSELDPLTLHDWREADALQNSLLDRLEPRVLLGRDVKFERVSNDGSDGFFLLIDVRKRVGVTFVRNGGDRATPIRTGTSTRSMSFEEIARRITRREIGETEDNARLVAKIESAIGELRHGPAVHLLAVGSAKLPAREIQVVVDAILRAPPPAVLLEHGLGCVAAHAKPPVIRDNKLVHGESDRVRDFKRVEVDDTGLIHFSTSAAGLKSIVQTHGQMTKVSDLIPEYRDDCLDNYVDELRLTPLVVSFVRLVLECQRRCSQPGSEVARWVIGLAVRDCRVWGLRLLGRPDRRAGQIKSECLWTPPVSALADDSDRTAFELLRELYSQRIVHSVDRPLEPIDFPGFDGQARFSLRP